MKIFVAKACYKSFELSQWVIITCMKLTFNGIEWKKMYQLTLFTEIN